MGKPIGKLKFLFYLAKNLLASSFLFPLSCCASAQGLNKTGQALIHLGVQGRLAKKKRSKEKSSQQKIPPRKARCCLVLRHARVLFAIAVVKG